MFAGLFIMLPCILTPDANQTLVSKCLTGKGHDD